MLFLASNTYTPALASQIELEAIQIQRNGLLNTLSYMDRHSEIFNRHSNSPILLNRQQKETTVEIWHLYLDYMSTLRALSESTLDYLTLGSTERSRRKELHALAFNAHYRFGLEFISRINRDPEISKWLNTEKVEDSLPKNFYRRFRKEFLSDWATDGYDNFNGAFDLDRSSKLAGDISQDIAAIKELNRTALLTKNSVATLNRALYRTWYPLQKNVARGMGKVKVWRIGETLITPQQAFNFSRSFEPGDFYITRKEWRLTNVGIPGFWTHSALYIGTPAERASYFNTTEINTWVASKGYDTYEALLRASSEIYAQHPKFDDAGAIRVIEALDAGVIFNSIETSLEADGAAIFRPRLSKLEKAKAIYNSFYYLGRPYDFHFDFDSDSAMVCSELIFKAYQASDSQVGIDFPLYRSVGKKMLTPSEIARWYDQTKDTAAQQIDLVMFIDSNERDRVAFMANPDTFTDSWKRPDWYIFKQPKHPENENIALIK